MLPELSQTLSRSDLLRNVLSVAAAAGAFRGRAAFAQINQPRLPPISAAPFEHVGVKYVRCGGARVKVFYPASRPSDVAAPYCTDGRTTSDGMAGLVGFKQLGLSFLLGHLADANSGCWLDAPPAPDEKLPLLVYSHGFGGNMDMASYLFRAFAAHGIVTAAIEHTDGTASFTELADGTQLPFSPGQLTREQQLKRRAAEMLAAAKPGALGSGLPPLQSEGAFLGGHSYGGPAALLASASAPEASINVRGLLLHDPALGMGAEMMAIRRAASSRSGIPTLSYVSDEYDRAGVRCGDATLHTIGGFHGNFVDAPLWAPYWVMGPLSTVIPAAGPSDPVELHESLARSAKEFFTSRDIPEATRVGGRLFELRDM